MNFARTELVELSKQYFESHPSEDVFYATPDGMFFTQANATDAKAHAQHLNAALETIRKTEITESKKIENQFSEGEPSDAWTVVELKSYMTENNIAFGVNDTKAVLLEKIAGS